MKYDWKVCDGFSSRSVKGNWPPMVTTGIIARRVAENPRGLMDAG